MMSAIGSSLPLCRVAVVAPAKCSATTSLASLTTADPESPWSLKNTGFPAGMPAFGFGRTIITLFRVIPAVVSLVLIDSMIPPVSRVRAPRLRTW